MKTTTLKQVVAVALVVLSQMVFANKGNDQLLNGTEIEIKDSSVCLHLIGKLPKSTYNVKSTYTVELLQNNTIIKSVKLNEVGDFNFLLSKNTWYALRITGTDCVPKLISINTALPKKSEQYLHKLYFEIDELINSTEASSLDAETLDFPLAVFCYNKSAKTFDYNKTYTDNIKKELAANLTGKSIGPNMNSGVERDSQITVK